MEETFDLVVVGSGSGLMAALTAADAGLSVLVVEKSARIGGSTALSGGGFWIPGNPVLAEAGVRDSPARIREYLRHVTDAQVPHARWETHVSHGPAAVDVLRRRTPLRLVHMRDVPDYFPELPGGSAAGRGVEPRPFDLHLLADERSSLVPPVFQLPFPMPVTEQEARWLNLATRTPRGLVTGAKAAVLGLGGKALRREYAAGGQALVAGLYAGVMAADVPVWPHAPLLDLLMEDGKVTGVVVRVDGADVKVHALRGVVLSSGGFDRNAEMRRTWQSPALDPAWCFGDPDDTGEVIQIAQATAGADLAFMDESWWFPAVPLPSGPAGLITERSLPGQLMVNGRGRRFMNEAVNHMTAGQIMLARHHEGDPHIPAWMVFDQRFRNRYQFAMTALPHRPLPQAWYDAGVAHRAASIAELAARVGLPDLPATVERFNLLAGSGHDDDFHRGESAYDRYYGDPTVHPNPCLAPVDQGPFYAVQVVPGDLGTCGGVHADGFARALRPDGSVIEGLYAIGNAAGNVFGRVHPGPGATVGQGLSYGYIAARHAAGRLAEVGVSPAA